MKVGRYNIPLALVKDRFILAIGGMLAKTKMTEHCEIFDSLTNNWYAMPSLEKARSCTSACVINNRFVYVFPGSNSNSWSTIEQLDLDVTFDA